MCSIFHNDSTFPIASDDAKEMRHSPETLEELSAFFRASAGGGLEVAIRGLSTQGAVPDGFVELSTHKLDKLAGIYKDDLVLKVQSGMPASDLNRALKDFELSLGEYSGTIGGYFCGAHSSPEKRFWMRRVMGMTFVRTDGDIIKLGTLSVKDVAGYRIAQFLLGSRGRLGCIASFTLNIAPTNRASFQSYTFQEIVSSASQPHSQFYGRLREVFDPEGLIGSNSSN